MPTAPTPLQPEKNPNRGFRVWLVSQIYTGPTGPGSYVPNVDDMVVDWVGGFGRVIDVDPTTNLSTVDPHNFAQGANVDPDLIYSGGVGTAPGAFCVYINASQIPIALNVHALWRTYSLDAAYAKIFKGTNIGSTGHVISALLDNAGNVISENLPMQLLVLPGSTNLGCKTVGAGYSTEALNDGETVSVVVYSAGGVVLRVDRLPVVNTGFIRTLDAAKKYVTDVELISHYLSSSNPNLIEYPVNMLVQSGMFQGRVHYSDGSYVTLPIDGTQMNLYGINSFVPTQVDQTVSVVLDYQLGSDEYGYNLSQPSPQRHVSKRYDLKVVMADGNYGARLYPVPVWNSAAAKYDLKFYLYTLTRTNVYEVSAYVSAASGSAAFNGTDWNNTQTLTVAFNMANLGSTFQPYIHLETFRALLKNPAINGNATQYVGFTASLDGNINAEQVARYVPSSVAGQYDLYVDNNNTQISEWLEQFYFSQNPLKLGGIEFAAPTPTHVRLIVGNAFLRIVPIADVVDKISGVTIASARGKTLLMQFIAYDNGATVELGCNHLIIKAI